MVGRTLADIRARLDELSVAVGPYRVVSTRTGDGPFPVTGRQFPDRETAAEAATVASAYRRALRRYDPYVTVHGLIVTEAGLDGDEPGDRPPSLPEYCHTVAGVLFETLSDRHGPVERAVVDAYLRAAERTVDRERLCLKMLESTAAALDSHLSTDEQATVLRGGAGRLPGRSTSGHLSSHTAVPHPLVETLDALESTGLLGGYSVEPSAGGPGRRPHRVVLSGYRPSLPDGRCPVLPVVVELLRYTSVVPHIGRVTRTEAGWELMISLTGDSPGRQLVVAAAD